MAKGLNHHTFEDDKAVVLWGGVAVIVVLIVGILGAAVARDNGGVHEFFSSQSGGAPELRPTAAPERYSAVPERYSAAPPLTVNREPRRRSAARAPTRAVPQRMARRPAPPARVAAGKPPRFAADVPLPPVWAEPPAGRPPVVSLFEDKTLRRGDAVMTERGIRIFAGSRTFPFRPEDFRAIASAKQLDIPFRKALMDLDRAPTWPS